MGGIKTFSKLPSRDLLLDTVIEFRYLKKEKEKKDGKNKGKAVTHNLGGRRGVVILRAVLRPSLPACVSHGDDAGFELQLSAHVWETPDSTHRCDPRLTA